MENKRYQIFISSTYEDLIEERAEVTQAIMELNHMPYGMEAFPAANEAQWEWIKRAIKESDYYVVIVGGKYGSISPSTLLSYTEMEYRYAIEIGIPTIAFLVDKKVDLTKSKIETEPDKSQKLNAFKDYIASHRMWKSYTTKDDLKAKVITSLLHLINHYPRNGWIRSDSLKDYTSNSEVIKLMKENEEIKKKLDNKILYQQGSDLYSINYVLDKFSAIFVSDTDDTSIEKKGVLDISWEDIFIKITGFLYKESMYSDDFEQQIKSYLIDTIHASVNNGEYNNIEISEQCVDDIIMQAEANKLIRLSSYKCALTQTGRNYYISKKALKR